MLHTLFYFLLRLCTMMFGKLSLCWTYNGFLYYICCACYFIFIFIFLNTLSKPMKYLFNMLCLLLIFQFDGGGKTNFSNAFQLILNSLGVCPRARVCMCFFFFFDLENLTPNCLWWGSNPPLYPAAGNEL